MEIRVRPTRTSPKLLSILLTFNRTRITEVQAILVELIEKFEFSIPSGGVDIRRLPWDHIAPVLRDDPMQRAQMPLKVTAVSSSSA